MSSAKIQRLAEQSLEQMKTNIEATCSFLPISCNNWPERTCQKPKCSFAVAMTDRALYVLFRTDDIVAFRCENTADQTPVSQDTCVEFFVKPDGSDEYWNFELNAGGALNASHRRSRPEPIRLSAAELAMVGRLSTVSEDRRSWDLLLRVPLELVNGVEHGFKANCYATSSKSEQPYYLSYASISTDVPDFHRPEFFADFIVEQ